MFDIYPACHLSRVIVPLWNPNSGRRQRDIWKPLTAEPDGLNSSLEQSQKAVGVLGQCGANGSPSFLGFGTSWSSRAVSQGRPPESSGKLSSGRDQAQDDCGRLGIGGRAPPFVKHLDIIFSLLKTLTILC